jgi:iron complex transport system substrate-binding protein
MSGLRIEQINRVGPKLRRSSARVLALVPTIASVIGSAALVGGSFSACRPARERAAEQRVVSLHDVTTELALAFGAERALVGVAEPVDLSKSLEPRLAAVPRVEGLESLRAARPDLVIGLRVVEDREPELVAALRRLGIPVRLWHPANFEDVTAMTSELGSALHASQRAGDLVRELQKRARPLPEHVAKRPRVFVYDCCEPPFTAGRSALLSSLVWRAGGQNVFADVSSDWAHVSWEEVLARRPELVVIDAYQAEGQGDVSKKQRALARFAELRALPVVVLPLRWVLGGPGAVDALEQLHRGLKGISG